MDPKAIEIMEERGGSPSDILPHQRWLAWRPVGGGAMRGDAADGGSEGRAAGGGGARGPALGVTSSGRMATTLDFRADRWDDGLLVGPAGAGLGGKRIVWVADLALVPLAAERTLDPIVRRSNAPHGSEQRWQPDAPSSPRSRRFRAPTVSVGTGTNVRVEWPELPRGEYALRFTVLCRPDDNVTFENEEFDSSVSVSARAASTRLVIQPYTTLDPVEIEVHAAADLRIDPAWRRGVDVVGADGTSHVEDRFSPGELRFRWDGSEGPLSVTARVLASTTVEEPLNLAVGSTAGAAACPPARYLAPAWLQATESTGRTEPDGPAGSSERLADLLWRTRALALSVEGGRVEDKEPLERVRGECVELAQARAGGGPIWRSLEGLRRWDESLSGVESPTRARAAESGAPPAVEHAALLHAVLVAAAQCEERAQGRRALERTAAALGQWFQDAFWLSTPRRFADRALPRRRRQVRGQGLFELLALRPHMVVACSLVGAPMAPAQRRDALRVAEARLMTPMGLRTLDFEAEGFDAHRSSRGLIFPWLLAPYVRASALAFGLGRAQAAGARSLVRALPSAPEAWYLEPSAPLEAARAVGAIGLTLHSVERRALDGLIGADRLPSRGGGKARRKDGRPARADSGCVDGEWVLR